MIFDMKNEPREEEENECIHHCSNCDQNLSDIISESICRYGKGLAHDIELMIKMNSFSSHVAEAEGARNALYDVLALLQEKGGQV